MSGLELTALGWVAFHARGDGVTDDSAALNAAIQAAKVGGGEVYLPAGTYALASPLVLPSNVYLRGEGKGATVLKVVSGANVTAVKTESFDTLTGGNTNAGPSKFGVSGLTIDGNKAGNASGWGVQLYGRDFTFEDFDIKNCASGGWYSEWYNSGDAMEARVRGFKIMDSGGVGMRWAGPHDSVVENGQVIRSTGRGIYVGPGATAGVMFDNVHVWGSGHTEGWYITAAGVMAKNCVAEGASAHQVWIDAADVMWDGRIFGTGSSDTSTGLRIGDTTTSVFPSRCKVRAAIGQMQTLVNFNREGGSNDYDLTLQPVATGAPMGGLPHATSRANLIYENGAANASSTIRRYLQLPGYINFSQAIAASAVPNNSIFLDSADNILKQKNNSGAVAAI